MERREEEKRREEELREESGEKVNSPEDCLGAVTATLKPLSSERQTDGGTDRTGYC